MTLSHLEDQVAGVKGLRDRLSFAVRIPRISNSLPLPQTASFLLKDLIASTSYDSRQGLVEKGCELNEHFWTSSSSPSKKKACIGSVQ